LLSLGGVDWRPEAGRKPLPGAKVNIFQEFSLGSIPLYGIFSNIVLNKIEKKKKEVVTKAENNYLSSECPSSTTSYGKINIIRANNLASAQRKDQVHHKKIRGR